MGGRGTVDKASLIDGVRRRTGLDEADAERAVEVVAGELGEALTWGEARNVADELSGPPARAMRDAATTTGGSNRYSPQMFLRIVGERLGTDAEEARTRAAAVLSTLRDLLPRDRFAAIVEELPMHRELLGGSVGGRVRPDEPPTRAAGEGGQR